MPNSGPLKADRHSSPSAWLVWSSDSADVLRIGATESLFCPPSAKKILTMTYFWQPHACFSKHSLSINAYQKKFQLSIGWCSYCWGIPSGTYTIPNCTLFTAWKCYWHSSKRDRWKSHTHTHRRTLKSMPYLFNFIPPSARFSPPFISLFFFSLRAC